jgi:hypothetical protein
MRTDSGRRLARALRAGCLAVTLAVLTAACTTSPVQPSASTNNSQTASVTQPSLLSPVSGTPIPNTKQPVTLVIRNAVVTGAGPTTYTFDVATDPGFSDVVQKRDAVPEGTNGQTTVVLDPLAAGRDYYWQVRVVSGGTSGVFTGPFKFTIGPAVLLAQPQALSPLNGSTTTARPTLTVADAGRQGPVTSVVYTFEIASNSAFNPVVASGQANETPGQTSFTPTSDLTAGQMYYWRATAIDIPDGVSSFPSSPQSFTIEKQASQAEQIAAAEGQTLWPGVQPAGTPGNATLGPGWGVGQLVSYDGISFLSPTLDELRVFDLLDRGFDPDAAIAWLMNNGYYTEAVYYASVQAIGFSHQYMALIGGAWKLVLRVGA